MSIEKENFSGQRRGHVDFIGPVGHRQHADADHEGEVKHFLDFVTLVLFTTILNLLNRLQLDVGALFTGWESMNSLDLRCAQELQFLFVLVMLKRIISMLTHRAPVFMHRILRYSHI